MTSSTVEQQITDFLVDRLGLLPEEVTPQARLKEDLGLDSLDMVELVTIVESRLGLSVDDEAAESLRSLGDVVSYIEAQEPAPAASAEDAA
ncbi:acyl carrier protein [Streptomyces olivoverticillatus]|uniref:Acyl carrier protein n=1 Tax=Streptomyces olivoverticillatus TaxID=66427 RepID=A0A7W7LSG6_9ACTN|nr:acyl carrier protein [Streptomyces olivoverticillatus]MBB4895512.1 acyl carrier protein [Streptomyces olivoverticillatus]